MTGNHRKYEVCNAEIRVNFKILISKFLKLAMFFAFNPVKRILLFKGNR
jgi:hypothetical protein